MCGPSQISGTTGALTSRKERPKSAKHGVRSRKVESTQIEDHSQSHAPAIESDFDLEERIHSHISRPKSAKFKARSENSNPIQSENELIMSRPKSAKHGRRARKSQTDNSNQNGQNGSYHRNQDQRVEGIVIPEDISAGEDIQTPRPLYRPKSRRGSRDQQIGSNGMYV